MSSGICVLGKIILTIYYTRTRTRNLPGNAGPQRYDSLVDFKMKVRLKAAHRAMLRRG
jgi:hypothetical protein